MVLRRAMAKGMSKFFLKDYNEILDVGHGWQWKESHWKKLLWVEFTLHIKYLRTL